MVLRRTSGPLRIKTMPGERDHAGLLLSILSDAAGNLRHRIAGLYALLIAANVAAWACALLAFHDHPVLLGTAMLAYSFGLRHAVDADHIAAIDNVTRTLMQSGKHPIAAGFFFSLGHSAVVLAACAVIAGAARIVESEFGAIKAVGAVVGTCISAFFLFAIAIVNVAIFLSVYRTFRSLKADRKSTRLNSSHPSISYAVFCLKKKNKHIRHASTA